MTRGIRYLLAFFIAICCFFIPCKTFAAILDDVDSVTSAPDTAYTLYLGMPFDDYVENFTNLSGWKYIGHQSISYNAVKENTSEGVLEVVSVMNEPGTKTVNNFCIHFYTNDYNLAENIYKRSVINLFNQLGNSPMSTKNVGLLNAYWIYNTYRDTNKYGYKRTVNNKVFVSLYKQSSQGYDYQVIIGRTQSETYDPR